MSPVLPVFMVFMASGGPPRAPGPRPFRAAVAPALLVLLRGPRTMPPPSLACLRAMMSVVVTVVPLPAPMPSLAITLPVVGPVPVVSPPLSEPRSLHRFLRPHPAFLPFLLLALHPSFLRRLSLRAENTLVMVVRVPDDGRQETFICLGRIAVNTISGVNKWLKHKTHDARTCAPGMRGCRPFRISLPSALLP